MAEQYGVPVILHTDHCAKNLLPWVDGLLAASERYYEQHGEPLFSSHMIDLSEEPIEENIEICKDYMKRMSKIGLLLEMELGITGGEEDGVDNSDRPVEDLYSKPEEIYQVYEELEKISPMYSGRFYRIFYVPTNSFVSTVSLNHFMCLLSVDLLEYSCCCFRKCARCLQSRKCQARPQDFG